MAFLKQNGKFIALVGPDGAKFLQEAVGAIERLLPHVQVSSWEEGSWKKPGCVWANNQRLEIRVTIAYGKQSDVNSRSLLATVKRKKISKDSSVIDTREYDLCMRVIQRISAILTNTPEILKDQISLKAITADFDEVIVSEHLQHHHKLQLSVSEVLGALHTISEQSYENKSLTFGCVLDPSNKQEPADSVVFPSDFLKSKKYKALSDGFRTAYLISTHGAVADFVDLERLGSKSVHLSGKNHYPDWAEAIAKVSRNRRCGIALSRQGDILVFDEGTLRFTYRFGRWQYWNHAHLINLLRGRAKAQAIQKTILGSVIGTLYRVALDVSFRRSGGLFTILSDEKLLHQIVRQGDATTDLERKGTDKAFDNVIERKKIQSLPRSVVVELASLDGSVVLLNSGEIVAYGAVLRPKKAGRLRDSEGSRTKAAIGASNYGLTVKISSDGDISVYSNGKPFIRV